MKKALLMLFITLFVKAAIASVYQVDNNSTQPGILTSIDSAMTLAINGDTILITPSPASYGDVYVTKQLTFIGDGYYNPFFGITEVDNIYIRESNILITGLEYAQTFFEAFNAPTSTLSNIVIERCRINAPTFLGQLPPGPGYIVEDVIIRNCVIQSGAKIGGDGAGINNHKYVVFDSLTFENNVITAGKIGDWGAHVTGENTVIYRNNLFIGGIGGGGTGNGLFDNSFYGINLNDVIFFNNIFYNSNPQGCIGCTFYHNLTYLNANDTLDGNDTTNLIGNPLFVSFPPGGGVFDFLHDYHLQQTPIQSPCIGTGVGGTDMGIYGGLYPFEIGAGPKIPVVDYVNISNNAVQQNSTFYLQFDAKTRK